MKNVEPASSAINLVQRRNARVATSLVLTFTICCALSAKAQTPTQSYLRNTPSDTERDDPRVNSTIARAEEHFKLGKIRLSEGHREAARQEFDKAIDTILESGLDLRENKRLNRYYEELVERIFREEVPRGTSGTQQGGGSLVEVGQGAGQKPQPPTVGFVEQKFEPSPLDELSKVELTREDLRNPPPANAKRACGEVNLGNLELRGFRLGMSQADVRARIPDLAVERANALGEALSFTPVRTNKYLSRNATLKGVLSITLGYLDGRVSSVALLYDDSLKWNSADEFVTQVAESLRLPSDWARYAGGNSEDQLRVLRCEDFIVVAGLRQDSYRMLPMAYLYDPKTTDIVLKRLADATERKRRAEEQRKRSFKP